MITPELIQFIRQAKLGSKSPAEIKTALLNSGWNVEDVEDGILQVFPELPSEPKPMTGVLLSATVLFGKTWKMYKERFGKIFLAMIPPFIISTLLGLIFLPQVQAVIVGYLSKASIGISIALIAIGVILAVGILLVTTVSYNALIVQFKGTGTIPTKQAFKEAWPLTLSGIWIGLLVGLSTMGGYILFIVPGFLIMFWLIFSSVVLVIEGKKGMAALLASKHYAQGYVWKIIWRFIVLTFFVGILALILGLIMSIVSLPLLYVNGILGIFITSSLNTAASTFLLQPLSLIFTILIYYNLKAIKGEGVAPKGKKLIIGLSVFALLFTIIMTISFSVLFYRTQSLQGLPPSLQIK